MKRYLLLISVIFSGLVLKVGLLTLDVFPFNSDEAIVGLMARHILMGERPIFFYGQAYMGSLDAFLVAGFFSVFGQSVSGIRLVQVILYLFTIMTGFWVGSQFFYSFRAGLITALFLAIPPVNTTLYTTVSLGGYGEALLIGNLILIATGYLLRKSENCLDRTNPREEIGERKDHKSKQGFIVFPLMEIDLSVLLWLLWGFLCGFGLWVNGLTLVYSVPAGFMILFRLFRCKNLSLITRSSTLMLGGLVIGSLPWWIFAFQNGLSSLIQELFGAAVAVESEPFLLRSLNHILYFVILGLPAAIGLRPPWDVFWLGLPLLPLILLLWGKIVWDWFKTSRLPEYRLIEGVALTLFLGYVFTSFGVDPSGRYFLPVWVTMSLIGGKVLDDWGKKKPALLGLVGLVSLYNLWGNLQCASSNPPGLTTQFYPPARVDMRHLPEVIEFLRETGEIRGYSNYWVAYPMAFLTNEEIIFSPRLPYHPDLRYTRRDDRYPIYTKVVDQSNKVALITTRNPALDEKLQNFLQERRILWNEKQIGDFIIYYNLSEPIQIVDLEKLFIPSDAIQ
ncbi:MAG: hypothetical protein AB1457_03070 [Chloroflexota bacterium]